MGFLDFRRAGETGARRMARKRIKSFCGARPTQKLRWSERGGGWLRRPGLWNFQAGIGAKDALGGAIGRRVAAVGSPLCRWIAGACGWRRSYFAFKPSDWERRATSDHGPLDAGGGDRSFSVGERGWSVMALVPTFGGSSRTKRSRPARQQGQTRGPSACSGLEASSLALAGRGFDGGSS